MIFPLSLNPIESPWQNTMAKPPLGRLPRRAGCLSTGADGAVRRASRPTAPGTEERKKAAD